MDIDEYCNAAKSNNNLKNDSALARKLGKSHNAVTTWKTRRSWPNDDTMIALADLAGIDPIDALIDLNIWRSHGPAIAIYTRMKTALAGTAAALFLALTVLTASPQDATAQPGQLAQSDRHSLYIMENIFQAFINLLLRSVLLFSGVFFSAALFPDLEP